jgi:peptidoglycan/LPS O-acetylase OafA/YrhL
VALTQPSDQPRSRLWEIEGLRAVAAWSIVIFHVWVFTSPAVFEWNLGPLTAFVSPLQSGVTLFFVLSGFLLYRPVAAALLDGERGPATLAYLRNRALRILPAYLVVLLIAGFVLRSASLGISAGGVMGGQLSGDKTLVLDVLLLQTYVPRAIWSGILPAWSLTVEVAFYVLLPLLALAGTWFARGPAQSRRRVAAAAGPPIAMLVLGGLGKTLVGLLSDGSQRADVSSWHGVLDRSLLTHADLFGFGMGAALILLLWERGLADRVKPVLKRELARPLAYVGLPTVFLGYYLMPAYAYDAAVAFLVAVVLLRLLAAKGSSKASAMRSHLFLTHRWTLWAGRRSYSVFLWNYPLLAFLSAHHLLDSGGGAGAFVVNLAIAVPAVAILAALTYRFVEAPALRLKRRRRETATTAPAVLPAS